MKIIDNTKSDEPQYTEGEVAGFQFKLNQFNNHIDEYKNQIKQLQPGADKIEAKLKSLRNKNSAASKLKIIYEYLCINEYLKSKCLSIKFSHNKISGRWCYRIEILFLDSIGDIVRVFINMSELHNQLKLWVEFFDKTYFFQNSITIDPINKNDNFDLKDIETKIVDKIKTI